MKTQRANVALALALLAPVAAWSQISLTIDIAPPMLPVYAQPIVPGEGYLWAPGYWGWNGPDRDYYWVPGTWVTAPSVGMLWTPGYWGYESSNYRWHGGYWGGSVGFYGGVNYGYGYTGMGYQGGRWNEGVFQYNRAVSNVNTTVVHSTYNVRVVNNTSSHVSFNGGAAGIHVQPTAAQTQMAAATHVGPTAEQEAHEHLALTTPTQRATLSHGAPPVAATPKPSTFSGAGVEPVRGKVVAHATSLAPVRQAPEPDRPSPAKAEPEKREPQAASSPPASPPRQVAQHEAPAMAPRAEPERRELPESGEKAQQPGREPAKEEHHEH